MQKDNEVKNCILTAETARRMIRRMAFQVAEDNTDAQAILLIGVVGNGELLATKLAAELKQILPIEVGMASVNINKKLPLHAMVDPQKDFTNDVIIVVDDVSNSGKTLLYSLKPFLDYLPKKIQTLVLVERSHKQFAIQPDYVGLTVATTLQEHISVETKDGEITGAWLY
jgi:pyrimidine operon attenuation protein/uracil phosphoribosyltransferase